MLPEKDAYILLEAKLSTIAVINEPGKSIPNKKGKNAPGDLAKKEWLTLFRPDI